MDRHLQPGMEEAEHHMKRDPGHRQPACPVDAAKHIHSAHSGRDTDEQAGDRIILATDGVTEAEARDGEFYGDERLEAAVKGCTIEAVLAKVEAFMNGTLPNDDYTMLEVLYSA
jgi:hypothetical protein